MWIEPPKVIIGSPPLTRGPLVVAAASPDGPGITPAYAGTTSTIWRNRSSPRDHPRLRGDHQRRYHQRSLFGGSPPLTRGPLPSASSAAAPVRITPAYAGTTPSSTRLGRWAWDHPRLRGDHSTVPNPSNYSHGSPPLTRGPRRHHDPCVDRPGITPAYAGTTLNLDEYPEQQFKIT